MHFSKTYWGFLGLLLDLFGFCGVVFPLNPPLRGKGKRKTFYKVLTQREDLGGNSVWSVEIGK
jgi:hypothetical protein